MRKSSARNACKTIGFNRRIIALAVASCFVTGTALANPSGATVSSGSATISSTGSTLSVTNTPNTIINWHDFSINTGETTQFIQQSASSAVLNRITGGDPSLILGTLQSNGRVFLVNPAGIVFGVGSVVDVAGLVASTLNITDADFLAGKHIYNANIASPGSVTNAGEIRTPSGGFVYLIGTKVENSGVITTPSGEAILAAGNSVEIVDSTDPSLRVTVSAQSQDVNLSQLMLQNDGNIFGVLNSGRVSANTVTQDATGKIYFKSAGNIETTAGSITEARGTTTLDGGHIQAFADLNGNYSGTFDASGQNGGFIETSAGYLDISDINLNLGALAAGGRGGNWLLDPFDFTINTAEANAISTALSSAVNVTIDTTTATVGNVPAVTGAAGVGNIVVNANINGAYGGTGPTLTLSADNNISIAAGVSIGDTSVANGGNFTLVMNAGNTVAGGSISLGAGSKIDIISSATLNANGTIIGDPTSLITASSVSLGTTGYDINAHVSTPVITAGSGTTNAPNNSTVTIYDDMSVDNAALTVSTACTVCVTLITTPAGATNLILSANPGAVADINFYGASNTLTFTQALTSLIRGVSITSEGNLTVNSNNLTMDASTINAQSNLILGVTGAFNADNSAEIDIGTGGQINAGSINFNNGSLINSNGPLTTVSGNISLDNGSNIFSNSTLTLNATPGSTTSDIMLANSSYIEGDGGLKIGQLSAYRNISLLSNSSITSNEYLQLTATGLLTLDNSTLYGISNPGAGYPDSITVNGLNMLNNSTIRDYGSPLSINVLGSSNLNNSTVQTDADALTFTTRGNLLASNSIIRNDSNTSTNINVGSALTLQNSPITSAGNVTVNAGGAYVQDSSDINAVDIHLSGASLTASNGSEINANNNLSLISGGAIDLNSGISVDVTNSINISGGSLNLNLVSFFEGRDITINLGGALSLTDAEIRAIPGNVIINAGSITETSSSSINGNNVQIASAGNVMLTDSNITSSGILSLTTGSLTETRSSFGAPSPGPTPTFISINSAGNIVLNDGSDIVANNEVSITTEGKIYLNSGTSGESHISTYSNNTIFLDFPTLFSGGFVLDGIEGIFFSPYNPFTGFFTGSTLNNLAILNQNLFITYGGGVLAGIIGATNPTTVATNPYLDPFGPNQTGPGDSSYTTGIFWGPTGDGLDQVRECS